MKSLQIVSIGVVLNLVALFTGANATFASSRDAAARAKFFNAELRAPADLLNRPVGHVFSGVRNVKTVLPGVLYRGGGPGGKTELDESGLQSLCKAGFSIAYYLYPDGFTGERTVNCTGPNGEPNALKYVQSDYFSPAAKYRILAEVYRHVQDASEGPVFVHCWNGYHASGEIAAVALRQFCEYGPRDAQNYWLNNQQGADMISRIASFSEFADLRITSDLQSAVCPRRR